MKEQNYSETDVIRATASLQQEIEDELNAEDPSDEDALQILKGPKI